MFWLYSLEKLEALLLQIPRLISVTLMVNKVARESIRTTNIQHLHMQLENCLHK
jgi:hypothetical protein